MTQFAREAPRSRSGELGEGRLLRGLRRNQMTVVSVLVGLALAAPSLRIGLIFDDYLQRQFILDHLNGAHVTRPWWDMFDHYGRREPHEASKLISNGALPWWASPRLTMAFFRPLGVALQYVDYLLWPNRVPLMHLHNLVWYAVLIILAAQFYRDVLSPLVAGLATLLYAVNGAHLEAVAWIAGRNTLMTGAFVSATILAWHRAQQRRSWHWVILAALSLISAHASSEGGIAAWPYILASSFMDEHPTSPSAFRVRSLGLLACVSTVWLVATRASGFVLRGGGCYVDPRTDPWVFAKVVVVRFPELLRALFVLPQPIERALGDSARAATVGASCILLIALGCLVIGLAERQREVRYLVCGTLGAGVIACSALIEPRLLLVSSLGASGIIAQLILFCYRELKKASVSRYFFALIAFTLGALHLPVAAATGAHAPHLLETTNAEVQDLGRSLPAGPAQFPLIIINTPSHLTGLFAQFYGTKVAPRFIYILGASSTPVKLTRRERNVLVLEPGGGYLRELTSQAMRQPSEPFVVGQSISVLSWRIVVESVTRDGRPARVRVEVPDVKYIVWASWNSALNRFARVRLPAVGSAFWLPGSDKPGGPSAVPLLSAFQ